MPVSSLSPPYFSSLLPELATRAARATISTLGFSNPALRQYLSDRFSVELGEPGCFVGEPVFEATFGWESANIRFDALAPSLLSRSLVHALDQESNERYPHDRQPHRHQLEAWELLARPEPQSVIVTSGTGSGKTECFMIPILDQLAREAEASRGTINGVRALFLYPLNALIQSQQERLHAWTFPFEGKIRFCLYNGQTPERPDPQHIAAKKPNQVLDRQTLRSSPPSILVTNATMLEYMLVRSQDAPILEQSKGKLQWIVLDEAHSYIGSQAAELSLLLRRVLHGFGVDSSNVRFVATSATIGDPKGAAGQKLKEFLGGLAGVSPERVHVVSGQRTVPALPASDPAWHGATLDMLEAIEADDDAQRFAGACANPTAMEIRRLFVPASGGRPAQPLRAVCDVIAGPKEHHTPETKHVALRWLDLLTRSRQIIGKEALPYLPLRLHAFHNVLPGLWACCDQACRCRTGTALDSPDWGYGAIYTEPREVCDCGSPVYELKSCNDCNETYLWSRLVRDPTSGRHHLRQDVDEQTDEFQLEEITDSSNDGVAAALADEDTEEGHVEDGAVLLIANRHLQKTTEATVTRGTQLFDDRSGDARVTLRVQEMADGRLNCPECGGLHRTGQPMFRSARIGAPFLLMQVIPTLLEFCSDGEDPLNKPMRGRRMITFTDSRQGTARMAAALQRDTERNSLRSAVYRKLATAATSTTSVDAGLAEQIQMLKAMNNPSLEPAIALLERRVADASAPSVVTFEQLAEHLAAHEADVNRWALTHYRAMSLEEFEGPNGRIELARLFLYREFSRRPKRANSLETMGLVSVQYPKLGKLAAVPPQVAALAKMTVDEWRQFLKLTLDFVVREMSCLAIKDTWRRWVGKKAIGAQFLSPDSKDPQTRSRRRWPRSNRVGVQNRMVRLLAATFNKDPETPEGRDAIDSMLRAAWDDLVRLDLLQKSTEGRYLSLEDLAFGLIGEAWICPVTRRVLDVTLRGVTPHLPGHQRKASTIQCQKILVPTWDKVGADFEPPSRRVEAARRWLSTDDGVMALRAQGVWTNINDRVVEGVRYYRTAEHSAQQSSAVLKEYESKFKEGHINLLSCSTTMEMGVDIGGISVVAMNNVPPHPSNYLQRAGRAGRRSETRSIALTVCKNNPHDQMVFDQPMWPFVTPLPAPVIKLESPVIVQRHVNAMLLADFLWMTVKRGGDQADLNKLNLEWWALPIGASRAEEFIAQVESFDPDKSPSLSAGLQMLLRQTCFDSSVPLSTLAKETAAMMRKLLGGKTSGWFGEYLRIAAQLSAFDEKKHAKEPAFRALAIQKKRLTDEYLLRELASGGFLPGYGFPTNVTSFDMLNMEALSQQKKMQGQAGREDNKMRNRDLPSRDAVTALREYAPGSDVVIDGQVYRSAGITLNWHAPASVDVKQIQSIRQAWRCSHCGASGTEVSRDGHTRCGACGAALHEDQRFTYLEPAGFAVDLYAPTHTDVSEQSYVPVSVPWINAEGEWLPLVNPALGSFRSSTTGRVFNHSGGAHGKGYAICLECGRAEPMPLHQDPTAETQLIHLPAPFRKPHNRLRGAQGGDSAVCKGSHYSRAIKPNLHLGLEEVTDVLELQLNGLDGLPISDKVAAYSIAVALRGAVASELGVEVGEVGCDVKPIRHPMRDQGFVIVLHDHAAAGYCSSVADRLPEMLDKAVSWLGACSANCKTACQHCLLDYDTRFRFADLDRFEALRFLNREWMQQLRLQAEDELFGAGSSHAEVQPLAEAVTRELSKGGATEVRLLFKGEPQDWDLADATLRRFVQQWAQRGAVKLILPPGSAPLLTENQRYFLAQITHWPGIGVHEAQVPASKTLAEVVAADRCTAWASQGDSTGVPGAQWGQPTQSVLVRGRLLTPCPIGAPLLFQVERPVEVPPKAGRLEIRGEMDTTAERFGVKLLQRLEAAVSGHLVEGEADIRTVIYRDRYLNAPLPVALLVSFISAIKVRLDARWDNPVVEIVTIALPEEVRKPPMPSQIFHNWLDTPVRDAVIKATFKHCGMDAVVRNLPKPSAAHARMLEIGTEDGRKLKIWLDQGFGYWNSPRPGSRSGQGNVTWFNFGETPSWQGQDLAEGRYVVEGQSYPTHLFFEKT